MEVAMLHPKALPALALASAVLFVNCSDPSITSPSVRPQFNVEEEQSFVLLMAEGLAPQYSFDVAYTDGAEQEGFAARSAEGWQKTVTMAPKTWEEVWLAKSFGSLTAEDSEPGRLTFRAVPARYVRVDAFYVVDLYRGADRMMKEGEQREYTGVSSLTVNVGRDVGAYVRVIHSYAICHQGASTLWVRTGAWKTHRDHGDTLGACHSGY
jgi:hypothetical protein